MMCRAQVALIAAVAVLGIPAVLGACGQKGPLYLPEAASPKTAAMPGSDVPRIAPAVPGASRMPAPPSGSDDPAAGDASGALAPPVPASVVTAKPVDTRR